MPFFLSTSLTTRSLPLAPTPFDPRPFGRLPPGPDSLGPFAAWLNSILRLPVTGVKGLTRDPQDIPRRSPTHGARPQGEARSVDNLSPGSAVGKMA